MRGDSYFIDIGPVDYLGRSVINLVLLIGVRSDGFSEGTIFDDILCDVGKVKWSLIGEFVCKIFIKPSCGIHYDIAISQPELSNFP